MSTDGVTHLALLANIVVLSPMILWGLFTSTIICRAQHNFEPNSTLAVLNV